MLTHNNSIIIINKYKKLTVGGVSESFQGSNRFSTVQQSHLS